jgi:hypothetical protein
MPRGGYRKPTNGAVLSPPGALSKRKAVENTAMQNNIAPGGDYGSRMATEQQMAGAPISKGAATMPTPEVNVASAPTNNPVAGVPVMPLMADTEFPEQPAEFGLPFNKDGQVTPGPEVLNLQKPDKLSAEIATVAQYLPDLRAMALQPDAPETFKYFVRVIESAAPQEQA